MRRAVGGLFSRKAEGIFFTFRAGRHAISGQSMDGLVSINYGETVTYGQQAKAIGVPNGARPVGSANALNPLPIILPCHRVIGSDGKLRGYAGGSDLLYIKEYLINHERANL